MNTSLTFELLEQVINTNATGIMIVDKNKQLIFWNKWLEKSSHIKKENVLNKKIFDVFPELKNSRIDKAIELSLTKGNASFISHAFNKTPFPLYSDVMQKKVLHQLTYIKPIAVKNNERFCFIQIKDSSTSVFREKQLRKMAEKAKELSTLKSGFVSSVSHELRTPLTSIIGSLVLLQSGIEDPNSEIFKTMINIAHSNAERLLLLINDILDIEKIESGKMEFDFSFININNLIESCITQNKGLEEKYKIKFNFKSNQSIPEISIDKDRIFQVLNNLMSNAAKFEPDNGTVNITISLNEDHIRVTIIDHGTGIPSEFNERIFQAFNQADVSNTKGVAGTGLGLAISKTIIEHHKGIIGFTSSPNEDTCFYFTLPLTIN